MDIRKLHACIVLGASAALPLAVVAQNAPLESATHTAVQPRGTNPGMLVGQVFNQEMQIKLVRFQIPDFHPEDLKTHSYYLGLFSRNGNGNGILHVDESGYAEQELRQLPGQEPMQTFFYSQNRQTDDVRVFIDAADMTINMAVQLLNNIAINVDTGASVDGRTRVERMTSRSHSPPQIGNQRRLGLHGDNLKLDDLQEQIFQQTRCNVEQEEGVFYLASCD